MSSNNDNVSKTASTARDQAAGVAKFTTSTLGNVVGGVTGAATRGVGDTISGATGETGKPVGDALGSLGTGVERGTTGVAQGVEDAGQWK